MSGTSELNLIRFGPFELSLETGELLRQGHRVRLQGQSFQILRVLLERRHHVVTRDELQQMLWPANTFVDFESGLNNAIKRLREALSDSAEKPRYIETLPRKGYRFIGEVQPEARAEAIPGVLEMRGTAESRNEPESPNGTERRNGAERRVPEGGEDRPALVAPVSDHGSRMPKVSRFGWGRQGVMWIRASGVALLSALLVLGLHWWTRAADLPPIRSLAVLPLSNLSGDASRDFFAAGVTEQLTTELGRMEDVRVISRTSADHYKGSTKTLPEIARELGADAVIEGAVAQSAADVRITVQLIRATSDQHLWARAYEGKLENILQMQDDVARSVAEQVRGRLSGRETAAAGDARRVNPEAYELYLRGLALMRADNGLDSKALETMQRSIAADPGYAPAYARESEAYDYLGGFYAVIPLNEARTKQKGAAVRALELDPQLSEAHQAMAGVKQNEWDWRGAEDEFRQALAANPNNAEAHSALAGFLMVMGRPAESLAEAEISARADPLAPYILSEYAWCLEHAGHHDEAVREFRKTINIDPSYAFAHFLLGDAYDNQQDFARAHAEYAKAAAMGPGEPKYMATLGYSFGKLGQGKKATAILNQLLTRQPQTHADDIAAVYAGLGDKEQALKWLENAYDQHFTEALYDGIAPPYRILHSDPRFHDLMRRVGVPVIPPS